MIKNIQQQKYLGIVFDNKLQWTSHINKICKSTTYYLYMIRCHRSSLTKSVSKMLIESSVLSRMKYAITVWGPALQKGQTQQLQRMYVEQGS